MSYKYTYWSTVFLGHSDFLIDHCNDDTAGVDGLTYQYKLKDFRIDHSTVVCLVAWPLNESEAGGYLVLIETSLLFLCKFQSESLA